MRGVTAAGLFLLSGLLMPAAVASAQMDHLEVLEPPKLIACNVSQAYFRVVLNAVDADRKPVAVGFRDQKEAVDSFSVTEGAKPHRVWYVGLSESGESAESQGNYIMLLLDTSGSMNLKLPSGRTRFAEAKAALSQSLSTFSNGVDHIAIAPFDSHNVAARIRAAAFQSTRQGVLDQLEAVQAPRPNNDTAIYSAVEEALPILKQKSDEGFAVSLVLFTDGKNDVDHPSNDRGLRGDEGFEIVRRLAANAKVPITTVGFGISGQSALVNVLRGLAWPSADSYYDAELDPGRLAQIFSITRKRLADRVSVLFGPVRGAREQLTGQSVQFTILLKSGAIAVATTRPASWDAPAIGVPVEESRCTTAEARAIPHTPVDGGGDPPIIRRLLILAMFGALLAALWFGAPRLMWPESYIPRPTFQMPNAPNVPGMSAPPMPRAGDVFRQPPSQPQSGPSRGGAPAGNRQPHGPDQTIVIQPRSGPRPAGGPRGSEPAGGRAADDETIFRPLDKDPRKGR